MWVWGTLYLLVFGFQEPALEYVEPDDSSGTSKAVVVRNGALAHTAQMLPLDEKGGIVGKGDAERQIQRVLDNLAGALREAGSGLDRVVRIHVCAARPEIVDRVRQAFSHRFSGPAKPAATFMVGTPAHPEALVAMDAVASASPVDSVRRLRSEALPGAPGTTHVAVLPAGPAVFVSGQTSQGELAEATRKTLAGLRETLSHFGLKDEHVVQVKAFLRPMSDASVVEKEITAFYGGGSVPPIVFVEWTLDPPIEIELVAAGTPPDDGLDSVRFLTPPGVKASPVFSRVARVDRGRLIYVSGLYGSGDAQAQVRGIFGSLQGILGKTGGDFRHLVKATYYVSDGLTTDQLGKLRLEYYDPERPPAASKAAVRGVGLEGRTITVDMIGVTRP
jgi:enamine deaminase RidA (YjgF/YER057c/UK114 family)